MSVEAINDKLAEKVGGIVGIKKAYGVGVNPAVAKLPDQIADGPVALVMFEGTTVTNASSFEDLEHRFTVHVYVAGADTGYAYKTLVPYISAFVAAFRTGRSLDGACTWCQVDSVSALEAVEINGRPYNRLPVSITAREVTPGVTTGI